MARTKITPRYLAAVVVLSLWDLVQGTLFAWSPFFCNGWRRFLLRLFGANIGKDVLIRTRARVTHPWKLTIGDYAWIGDDAVIYSLAPITIGKHAVVSQKTYLCAGTHDYRQVNFPQVALPIVIGDEAWVAADVFVGPGVTIGKGSVVGARSMVRKNVADNLIVAGNPLKTIGPRSAV